MENPQALNSNTYTIAATTSSATATLIQSDINTSRIIVYNAGTTDVFVVPGVTQPTAVFPTSATAPLAGKVIAGGTTQTFEKNPSHRFISAIMSSGSANIYISVGTGV